MGCWHEEAGDRSTRSRASYIIHLGNIFASFLCQLELAGAGVWHCRIGKLAIIDKSWFLWLVALRMWVRILLSYEVWLCQLVYSVSHDDNSDGNSTYKVFSIWLGPQWGWALILPHLIFLVSNTQLFILGPVFLCFKGRSAIRIYLELEVWL